MSARFDKATFAAMWPEGYLPTGDGGAPPVAMIAAALRRFSGERAAEIGPGGGYWTRILLEQFKSVYAVDVIPPSHNLRSLCAVGATRLHYIEIDDDDYLHAIPSRSVDFVFSNGVFCHLPASMVQCYLAEVARVLRADGSALLMFADWNKHPALRAVVAPEQHLDAAHQSGWFYQTAELVAGWVADAGLEIESNPLADSRDLFLHVKVRT